jgi:hypothetical protein
MTVLYKREKANFTYLYVQKSTTGNKSNTSENIFFSNFAIIIIFVKMSFFEPHTP